MNVSQLLPCTRLGYKRLANLRKKYETALKATDDIAAAFVWIAMIFFFATDRWFRKNVTGCASRTARREAPSSSWGPVSDVETTTPLSAASKMDVLEFERRTVP